MSHIALKINLERLLKKYDYTTGDLERIAGLKKNNIYNILEGRSKKPSAEVLQSIANIFGITVNDLLHNQDVQPQSRLTTSNNFSLFVAITKLVAEEILSQEIKATCSEITTIITEVYKYTVESNLLEADQKFIRWLVKQKYPHYKI